MRAGEADTRTRSHTRRHAFREGSVRHGRACAASSSAGSGAPPTVRPPGPSPSCAAGCGSHVASAQRRCARQATQSLGSCRKIARQPSAAARMSPAASCAPGPQASLAARAPASTWRGARAGRPRCCQATRTERQRRNGAHAELSAQALRLAVQQDGRAQRACQHRQRPRVLPARLRVRPGSARSLPRLEQPPGWMHALPEAARKRSAKASGGKGRARRAPAGCARAAAAPRGSTRRAHAPAASRPGCQPAAAACRCRGCARRRLRRGRHGVHDARVPRP